MYDYRVGYLCMTTGWAMYDYRVGYVCMTRPLHVFMPGGICMRRLFHNVWLPGGLCMYDTALARVFAEWDLHDTALPQHLVPADIGSTRSRLRSVGCVEGWGRCAKQRPLLLIGRPFFNSSPFPTCCSASPGRGR